MGGGGGEKIEKRKKNISRLTPPLCESYFRVSLHYCDYKQASIVQELCESRGGRPGLSVLTSLLVSVDVKLYEPCFGIGLSLPVICQLPSEDIKQHYLPTYLPINKITIIMAIVKIHSDACIRTNTYSVAVLSQSG